MEDSAPARLGEATLAVVVPAYNEEHGVAESLPDLFHALEGGVAKSEVIVVDDGSADATARECEKLLAPREGARLFRHPVNRGYGAALKTGILASEADLIAITDADGTYPSDRLPDLCAKLLDEGYDMVVGARTGDNVSIPLIRWPVKWVLARLVNAIARTRVPDANSGLRVFRRDVAMRFLPFLPDGFSFTTTITLGMLVNGYRVAFVPIDYYHRVGRSKIAPVRDTLRFVRLIVMVGLYFAPLRVFMPFAGILFLLAILWAVFSYLVLGRLADVSTLVIVMASVQVASVGLLAELINRRLHNELKR